MVEVSGSAGGTEESIRGLWELPTTAAPPPSRKVWKTGHIAAIGGNGLASNYGNDKDAKAAI